MNNIKTLSIFSSELLNICSAKIVPIRHAYVLKRKFPIRLNKTDQPPKPLRSKDFVYDLVKDELKEKKDNIEVLLTSYVEGLGKPGDIVSVRPFGGYDQFLLPKLAVYATPENIQKYSHLGSTAIAATHSSKYSYKTLKLLSCSVIGVQLNDTTPWTIEPWHMRVAFRSSGFVVPESSIELPNIKITGPDKEQHRKEFYVTVTISETEKVKVRCRIYLVGINSEPAPEGDWAIPSEPLNEEFRSILDAMPKVQEQPFFAKVQLKYSL